MTGRLKDITRDIFTKKYIVSFVVDSIDNLEEIKESLLSIVVKVFRGKRSLNANALMWKCLSDIAASLNTDKWTVYLKMLKRYGKFTYIITKPCAVKDVKKQWREVEEVGTINVNGQEAVQLLCYFGSSTYDTKEFSVLLDGIISEMKEMGIPTPGEEELERSLELWEKLTA